MGDCHMMRSRFHRSILAACGSAAFLLSGCTTIGPLSLAKTNQDDSYLDALARPPASRAGNPSSNPDGNSASLIANNSASLSGQLQIPDASLIANNSASLTSVGGGAFYRLSRQILALESNPLANAVVSLLDANGNPFGSSVKTDAQGNYAFNQILPISGPVFVQADFSANGKDFSFKTLLTALASTSATADIDVASTLVAAKTHALLQRKIMDPKALSHQKLQALMAQVRSTLIPGLVPYMARNSGDLVPTLDQLTLDNASIQQAASSIAPAVAVPLEAWQVSTLHRRPDIQAKSAFFIQFNGFEADKDGNLYFYEMTPTSPTTVARLWKLTPSGGMSIQADLPVNPASITAAPDGSLYVVGVQPSTPKVVVCRVIGTSVSILPGYLAQLGTGLFNEAPYGRLAIDGAGNLYAAYKFQHVITKLASGSATPEIFAGAVNQPGHADGMGASARFKGPMSPVRGPDGAIYVADSGNGCIRRIALDGNVTTYVGQPNDGSYRNGRGAYARFGNPNTLVLDAKGNCIISDGKSLRVRRISPEGSVFLIAGSGASGSVDAAGPEATFNMPKYLAIDGQGKIYVLDNDGASPSIPLIRMISTPDQ